MEVAGCLSMEVKDCFASITSRKRNLETRSPQQWPCKHGKAGPQILAPACLAPHTPLKWLVTVIVKPDPSIMQRSGKPLRFMYMNKGQWEVYSSEATAAVSARFAARKKSAKFSVVGRLYVVDFAHMVQLNLQSGYARSVAWIDDTGEFFAPARCFEGGSGQLRSLSEQASQQLFSECSKHDIALTCSGSSQVSPSAIPSIHDFSQLGNRLLTLGNNDEEFCVIKEKFLSGLGLFARYTSFIGIHRCSYEGTSAQVRLETFQRQERAVEAARGNANVCYAWHGTSKKGVLDIILHGFGQPGVSKHGAVYGSGVCLVSKSKSVLSTSDVDENGAQHTLLCKVLLGKVEHIHEGSEQFFPSSEDYDIGVDDVTSPSRYIVWSTHVNTYILPQFVVSFKLAPPLYAPVMDRKAGKDASRVHFSCNQPSAKVRRREEGFLPEKTYDTEVHKPSKNGAMCVGLHHKTPQSPWISFPDLFSKMGRNLSPCALAALHQLHSEFQAGRLPRKVLVKRVRALAGDAMLRECIMGKSMHPELVGREEGYDSS